MIIIIENLLSNNYYYNSEYLFNLEFINKINIMKNYNQNCLLRNLYLYFHL